MSNLVIIKPRPNSRKFQTGEGGMNAVYSYTDDNGVTRKETTKPYNRERFPKSRQMFRGAYWSNGKRRWMLKGFDEKNREELNELVAACKLRYPKAHKRGGDFIETADIFDPQDAFFTHMQFKIIAQEGEALLDKDVPLDRLILAGLQFNPYFALITDETSKANAMTSRVRYWIVDKELQNKDKKVKGDKERRAAALFEALNDAKRLVIATSLGLVTNPKEEREIVDTVLWEYAKDQSFVKDTRITKQDWFIQMCEMDTATLNIHHIIAKAKSAGFLKKTKQGYLLFGENIGKVESDVEKYFKDPTNQEKITRIQEQIEED